MKTLKLKDLKNGSIWIKYNITVYMTGSHIVCGHYKTSYNFKTLKQVKSYIKDLLR